MDDAETQLTIICGHARLPVVAFVELLVEQVLGDAETTQTNARTECLSLKTDSRSPLEIKIFTCSLDVERLRWCRIGLSLL